ncbi:MAG TPA: TIGR03790 family protein, partial [Pseudomonadales bacterium]|nr:TIGR03790 family protein [Pseudomonadales bacterium]
TAALLMCAAQLTQAKQAVNSPPAFISADQLGVIVNDDDELSQKIADYYQKARHIPPQNLLHVKFPPKQKQLDSKLFSLIKQRLDQSTPANIQAYALTWAEPYRVGCMSISSAFAFGYDEKYCASGCKMTEKNPFAGSNSHQPFADFAIRPTMLLAAASFDDAKQLIDRGVQSDYSRPLQGSAYLVETPDPHRNVRKAFFPQAKQVIGGAIPVKEIKAKAIYKKDDVMFYFTGDVFVEGINTNHYLPGAMADHLTSTGGQLTDSSQMSALKWLQAGATGSYGTVVEPCNILAKFPHPIVAIASYLRGDTLIEAYWRSVLMPGQGVFIGEPLARPYGIQ